MSLITHARIPGQTAKIELLKNGIAVKTIAARAPAGKTGTGSYSWKIPFSLTPGDDYRVRFTDNNNSALTDTSVNDFTIAAPTITLISPNGGEIFDAATEQTISWTYTGNPGSSVKIELVKDGATVATIAPKVPLGKEGSGSHSWNIPIALPPGGGYRVKITGNGPGAPTDMSDGDFSVTGPTITLVSPNGGESIHAGTERTISWNYTGNPGKTVKIELLKGGEAVRTIAGAARTGADGNGFFTWKIPSRQAVGSDYLIRITSVKDAMCTDVSDGPFTIEPPALSDSSDISDS